MSVPRAPLPHLVALVCGVLAAVAVGCGDRSNLIPPSRADSLAQQLSDIKAKVDQGECDGITGDVRQFRQSVTSLSGSIDSGLRRRLREGADSLLANASDDCAAARLAQTDTTATTDTTTTETATTDTQTVTTVTTTTDTTPTDTTPADTTTVPTTSTPTTTMPEGVTGTTPDNGNGGVVPPEEGATP